MIKKNFSTIGSNFFAKNEAEEKTKKANPQQITLEGYPDLIKPCFDLLQAAGARYFALFGGAVRDADYAAYYHQPCKIKDYDIRIWFDPDDFEEQTKNFLGQLSA